MEQNEQLQANEQMSAAAQADYQKKLTEYAEQNGEPDERTQAKLFAQAVELQVLKAPLTAIFCGLDEMTLQENANGSYTVSGYVNAQNSYGALIKTPFSLLVFKVNEEWKTGSKFVAAGSGGRGGKGIGGFLIGVSIVLDIVSMFFIGDDYEVFKGLIIAGSIIFFIGIVIMGLSIRAGRR